MAVKVAKLASIDLGGNKVAEMGVFTMSGFTREALESHAFQDDVKEYVFGVGDGGEISFSGNYDATDTTGQDLLHAAATAADGSVFAAVDLKFFIDTTSYFRLTTGGTYLITKALSVAFDKAGLGTTEFTAKVSGGSMYLV